MVNCQLGVSAAALQGARWFGLRRLGGFQVQPVCLLVATHKFCLYRIMEEKLLPECNCGKNTAKTCICLPAIFGVLFYMKMELPIAYNCAYGRGKNISEIVVHVFLYKSNIVSAKPNKIRVFNNQCFLRTVLLQF